MLPQPKRALAAIFSPWLPGPATTSRAAPPGSSPVPATPAIAPPWPLGDAHWLARLSYLSYFTVAWQDGVPQSTLHGLACLLAGPGVHRRCEDLPPRKHGDRRALSGHVHLLPAWGHPRCARCQSLARRHRHAPRRALSSFRLITRLAVPLIFV